MLGLIHTNLVDLKQTMTRGGKNYFVTFTDDYSRYTKVYLIKHKDEAFDMFLSYKTEVENQLNKKIKRISQIKVVNMFLLMIIVLKKELFMK